MYDHGIDVGGPRKQPRASRPSVARPTKQDADRKDRWATATARKHARIALGESLLVIHNDASAHFAVMSPEAVREMNRGAARKGWNRQAATTDRGAARRAANVALAQARAAVLSSRELAARMTAGSAAYAATGED